MLKKINVVVVGRREGAMKALVTGESELEFEIDVRKESMVELVRRHFRIRWGAEVHAIGAASGEDLGFEERRSSYWFFLYADRLGELEGCEWLVPDGGDSEWDRAVRAALRFPRRQPWSRPGWLEQTRQGLSRVMGWVDQDELKQIRIGPNGTVLEFAIDGRRYFLKTVPECFSYEPALLEFLAKRSPEICAPWLPCRGLARTHLTQAIDGKSLWELEDGQLWLRAVRELGKFQAKMVDGVGELERIGVPSRGSVEFRENFPEIVASLVEAQRGVRGELSSEELEKLGQSVERAYGVCERLGESGVPDSLIHGDLNDSNVYWTVAGTKLIDWTFSRIGHPFFTVGFALVEAEKREGSLAGMGESLARVYLEPFERFARYRRLEQGLGAARRLLWIQVGDSLLTYVKSIREESPSGVRALPGLLRRFISDMDSCD